MHASIQSILDTALQLPESDRLEIAQELLDSLPDQDEGIAIDDPGFLQEMERRAQDSAAGISWKEIYAEG